MRLVSWSLQLIALLLLGGCASTQLNYNTLDLAASADHLLTAQVLKNLANFIGNSAAIPAQVVINGGTATTANTISPSVSDPFSKAVTAGTTIVTGATGALTSTTNSISAVRGAATATISGSNVATQNWAYDPVSDPDQLRRLYALYRFAVSGNDKLSAQATLALDYPLAYRSSGGAAAPSLDTNALNGPNCVLCTTDLLPPQQGGSCKQQGRKVGRAAYSRPDENALCVSVNPRLLPLRDQSGVSYGRWLKWSSVDGSSPSSEPPPMEGDIRLGQFGNYVLFIDGRQPDRLAQFELFIAVAAASSQSPSSAGGAGGAQKTKGSTAIPTGIILTQ